MIHSIRPFLLTCVVIVALTASAIIPALAQNLIASSGTTTSTVTLTGADTNNNTVNLTSTAAITINTAATGNPGANGTDGVDVTGDTVAVSVSAADDSSIAGANGGDGNAIGAAGGNGGIGVSLAGTGTSSIHETVTDGSNNGISGGNGGDSPTALGGNGGNGGNGGTGIVVGATYSVINISNENSALFAGNGGNGGTAQTNTDHGGVGGNGGDGVDLTASNGTLTLSTGSAISGGVGGNGGNGRSTGFGGNGGNGGNGISTSAPLQSITIDGFISGGGGENGGNAGAVAGVAGNGGNGGVGLSINSTAQTIILSASGFIFGGGGARAGIPGNGNGGTGGAGITIGAGATSGVSLMIDGNVTGGNGGAGHGTGTTGAGGEGITVDDMGAANSATITVNGSTVTAGFNGANAIQNTALDFSGNTGIVNLTLTGATIGSTPTPPAAAISLSATASTSGGDVVNLSGTNTIYGAIVANSGAAATNGTINLTGGTTTVGGAIGATGIGGELTAINISGGSTLVDSATGAPEIFANTINFSGAGGTIILSGALSGVNTTGGLIATGAGKTGLGTINISSTTSAVLAGNIGTSTDYLGAIDISGAGGATTASGTVFVNTAAFSADATLTLSSASGGSAISNVTTTATNTGTLTTSNTTGSNTLGNLGSSGDALKAVTLNGTGGATSVTGSIFATILTVNDNSSLTTSGSITGTSLVLGSANTTGATLNLNGAGTINTAIDSDGGGDHGILIVNGTIATGGFAANASDIGHTNGLASATISSGGTLTLNDNLTATTTTVASGGTLVAGASKIMTGALANNGTLALGKNTLTVTGNITGANGTIAETISNTGAGSIINTGNSANPSFTSGLTIATTVNGAAIQGGDKVDLVRAASGNPASVLPATTAVTSSTPSLLYNWNASVAGANATSDMFGNAVGAKDIILTATAVNASTIPGVSSNSASSLNALTHYTGNNATLLSVLSAAQNLTTGSALNTAAAQLRPDINGAGQQASFGAMSGAVGTVSSRSDSVRLAQDADSGLSSGEAMGGYGFWTQGFGSTGTQGTLSGVDSYGINTLGTAFGGDTRVTRNARLGASFAFASTGVDDAGGKSGSNLKTNSYIGTIYGSYTGTPWYVDADINAGIQNTDSRRLINFAGAPLLMAKGNYDSQQFGFGAEVGYPFEVVAETYITPFASFGYAYLNQNAYTESGASGADLAVNASNSWSARTGLGVKIVGIADTIDQWAIKPNASVEWLHEFNGKAPDQTSTFQGGAGSSSFVSTGVKIPRDTALLGVGVDLASVNNWTVSAKANLELRDEYTGFGGTFQIRKDF